MLPPTRAHPSGCPPRTHRRPSLSHGDGVHTALSRMPPASPVTCTQSPSFSTSAGCSGQVPIAARTAAASPNRCGLAMNCITPGSSPSL
jgi:hypothetical protein